jgi:hypothetical protein
VPADQWAFVDGKSIKLKDKAKPGFLYEFTYEAKNPKVQGLGFAATRDFVSWLKHDPRRSRSPAAGQPCAGIGFSQAGRYLRHHIRPASIATSRAARCSTASTATSRASDACSSTRRSASRRAPAPSTRDHTFPESWFPFSTATLEDPLTKQKGSVCAATAATRC